MRPILAVLLTAAALAAQPAIRQPSLPEKHDIQQAVGNLVRAANQRDALAAKVVASPRLDVRGEGRVFDWNGVSRWSEWKSENLAGAEVATLIREVRMMGDDIASIDGFFRTIHWPGGEFSGDVSGTLIRKDGKWLVTSARFAARQSDQRFITVVPASKSSGDNWIPLIDGKSMDAFATPTGDPISPLWSITDGALKLTPRAGVSASGLRSRETFSSFELECEWKVPQKGNSGLKYRLFYLTRGDAAGHEYQVADDAGDRGAIADPMERAGALYNVIAPARAMAKPVGEFNASRIIVRGRHVEHWLNGEKVVEYETESGPLESPILLQNHGTEVWYRNMRIRRLTP